MPPIELAIPTPQQATPIDLNPQQPNIGQTIEVNLAELRKKVKLFVATPMYGGQCNGLYMKSAINLQIMMNQCGIECRFSFLFNESLIPRARNYLVDEFLRSGYTHMLFIDSDIEFDPNDVMALMVLDKDVIGAPYPKKSIKWDTVKAAVIKNPEIPAGDLEKLVGDYVFNPVPGTTNFNVFQPLDVLEIGTGFMMVKREVYEKFKGHYPEYEYTPDHQGQSNFDGSRKIHAYFHCDIDNRGTNNVGNSNRYLSEDYWFCCNSGLKIDTENGKMKLGDIVRSKYSGKVKTLMPDGSFGFRNVTGWSRRKNTTRKKWVKINTENGNNRFGKLTCTDDHRVGVIKDVMIPTADVSYVAAKDIVGLYSVRDVQQNENSLYGKTSLSVLIGTLLGDATVSKNGQVSIVHSIKQHDYHEYKRFLLNGKPLFETKKSKAAFGPNSLTEMSTYPVNAQTKHLRDVMFEGKGKTVKNIIPYIDEIALAFWYMDDGSLNKKAARIASCGFTLDEHYLLIDMFKTKWNLNPVIDVKTTKYKGENRHYYGLRFDNEDTENLFKLIGRHIHPSMSYKLTEHHQELYNSLSPSEPDMMGYSASKIVEVKPIKLQSMLYDIEVDETHNFVGNGAVVHNCQLWRKMGGNIYLCPWMKTRHVGTYAFSGDLPAIAQLMGKL